MGRGRGQGRAPASLRDEPALVCHGRPMALLAESPTGRRVARATAVGQGVPFACFRCAQCGRREQLGWIPPTWINAVARAAERIRRELNEALAAAEQRELQAAIWAAWPAQRELESREPLDEDALLAFTDAPGAGYRAFLRRLEAGRDG